MEVGVIRDLIDDAGDFAGAKTTKIDCLAYGALRTKILPGKGPGDDETVGLHECGMGIACEKGEIEDSEEIGIDTDYFPLFELPRTVPDEIIAQLSQPRVGLDLGIGRGHTRSNGNVDHWIVGPCGGDDAQVDAIDVSRPRSKPVVVRLVLHKGGDQQAGGQTDRQAKNVDEGKDPVSAQVAQGDFDIVSQHSID